MSIIIEETHSSAPIGVFDSGVGGLTVAREIMRNLPDERIVYFGDTARVPYGSKSQETVIRYSKQIVRFLQTQHVKAIVIACNTASALALDAIEGELDIPILGVLRPGAKVAAETTKNKRVGVIATESTIRSGMYGRYIKAHDPEITVYGKACPLFVPLVEEGWLKDPVTGEIVTNASELEAYKNHMAEKAAGGTGKARGEALELSDAAAAARAAVAELKAERRRADDERRAEEFSSEIAKITALNPDIKGAEDLEALAEYDEIVALVARGYSPYDAYRTIYYDRDMAAAVSRGERQARAANASKAHLVPDKNTGSETGVAVPSEVRAMYREMMPGITDAEIDAAYKKYAAETNK